MSNRKISHFRYSKECGFFGFCNGVDPPPNNFFMLMKISFLCWNHFYFIHFQLSCHFSQIRQHDWQKVGMRMQVEESHLRVVICTRRSTTIFLVQNDDCYLFYTFTTQKGGSQGRNGKAYTCCLKIIHFSFIRCCVGSILRVDWLLDTAEDCRVKLVVARHRRHVEDALTEINW